MGLLSNKFGNLSIYHILKTQASNVCSVSYLECFGTTRLQFETVELDQNKVKFTEEQVLFYPLTGSFIYELWTFFTVSLI